jgi:RNA polymerase sigma-70 factor, ECF subfamily
MHFPTVYRVSLKLLKNHADAEDNLQNVFCKMYSNINQFEGRSRFSSWLVRIAINEALMKLRQRSESPTTRHSDEFKRSGQESTILEVEDKRINPEAQCIANELMKKALRGLSPLLRDTFIRHAAEGWTQRELASAMGVTIATVKSRIFRARMRMQRQLHVC